MSVVSDFHKLPIVRSKFIFKAIQLLSIGGIVLFTIVGNHSCKNVDKISDTLVFRYNEDASVTTLDPAYIKSQSEIWIASQIYNGLVELDSQLNPKPSLAKSWTISEDGLVYKFALNRGVQFHDQSNGVIQTHRWVTAKDVVYSFERLLNPEIASPGAWIFSDKVERRWDENSNKAMKPFYAENDSTFVLRLSKPFSAMLSLLGTSYCFVVPSPSNGEKQDLARHPVGTGPFFLKYWEEDVKMVLRKNKFYFEYDGKNRLPYLESVAIDFIKNKQTAFMRFVAGEYDFFNGIESGFKDELLTKNGMLKPKFRNQFKMIQKPFLNTEYLGFYLGKNKDILNNVHIRRAMSYAIDRDALVRYLRNGLGIAGNYGFVPPVLVQNPAVSYSFDKLQAQNELKAAGFPGGKGFPELELTTTADYLDMAVYLKKYWQDIGIQVKISVQSGGMLRQMRNKGDLQIFRGSWIADFADAENYLACFYSSNFSPSGPNYTHFQSSDVDQLYQDIAFTNSTNRNQKIKTADSMLMKQAPVIVLYYDKSLRLLQNNVHGLGNDYTNRLILKRTKKTPVL